MIITVSRERTSKPKETTKVRNDKGTIYQITSTRETYQNLRYLDPKNPLLNHARLIKGGYIFRQDNGEFERFKRGEPITSLGIDTRYRIALKEGIKRFQRKNNLVGKI